MYRHIRRYIPVYNTIDYIQTDVHVFTVNNVVYAETPQHNQRQRGVQAYT